MQTPQKQPPLRSSLTDAVALAMTAAMLVGCQSIEPSTQVPHWRIEPTQRVTNTGETASNYYALGRYYQGQNRIQLAAVAYRNAIALDPNHAEAHNALGAMIGMQGRLDEAIAEFRRALELAPSAPHILSNLGYALTLQGRASEAVPLLQRAASLDSGNTRISVNLGLATSKVEKAVAPTAPIEPASKPEKGPAIASAPSEIEEPYASEQMRAASGPELALQTRRGGDGYRLEIANGMGFSGAAAKVAEWLARDGAPSAQLRNKRPFGERTTVIYFSRGFEQQGQLLATGLGIPSVPVREAQLSSSDIRIEIGSDMLPLLMADGVRAGI